MFFPFHIVSSLLSTSCCTYFSSQISGFRTPLTFLEQTHPNHRFLQPTTSPHFVDGCYGCRQLPGKKRGGLYSYYTYICVCKAACREITTVSTRLLISMAEKDVQLTHESSIQSSRRPASPARSSDGDTDFETRSIRYKPGKAYDRTEETENQLKLVRSYASGAEGYPGIFAENQLRPVRSYSSGAEGYPGIYESESLRHSPTGATLNTVHTV